MSLLKTNLNGVYLDSNIFFENGERNFIFFLYDDSGQMVFFELHARVTSLLFVDTKMCRTLNF